MSLIQKVILEDYYYTDNIIQNIEDESNSDIDLNSDIDSNSDINSNIEYNYIYINNNNDKIYNNTTILLIIFSIFSFILFYLCGKNQQTNIIGSNETLKSNNNKSPYEIKTNNTSILGYKPKKYK